MAPSSVKSRSSPLKRGMRTGNVLEARQGWWNLPGPWPGQGNDRGRGQGDDDHDDQGRGRSNDNGRDDDKGRGNDNGRGPGADRGNNPSTPTAQQQPAPTPTPKNPPAPQVPPPQGPKTNVQNPPPVQSPTPVPNPTPGSGDSTPVVSNPAAASPGAGDTQGNGNSGNNPAATVPGTDEKAPAVQGPDQTQSQPSTNHDTGRERGQDTTPTSSPTEPTPTVVINSDAFSSTDWSGLAPGARGRDGLDDGSGTGSSTNPGAVAGGFIAGFLILIILIVLLLYKYRRTHRVQSFLIKYTPFKIAPYTAAEKKRSSMGEDLLFTDGSYGDALLEEKSNPSASGYGTMESSAHPAAAGAGTIAAASAITVTTPSRSALPRERPDAPPPPPYPLSRSSTGGSITNNNQDLHRVTIRPFPGAPPAIAPPPSLDLPTPRTPPPTLPNRRASQDSINSTVTTATTMTSMTTSSSGSSAVSPLLISWPMPPSSSAASFWARSSTRSSSRGSLAEMSGRYTPLGGNNNVGVGNVRSPLARS